MASNIQLAATTVAQTGTGVLYTPYSQGPDSVIWTNGSGATRSRLSMNRTQPKPTPSFPGVERLEFKTNQFFTVSGVEYQTVIALSASIPVTGDSTHRTAMASQLVFMAHDATWWTAITGGAFPT